MSVESIIMVLLAGFVAYLVLQVYKALLGCILLSVMSLVILALIYGVLRLLGLAS